MPGSSDVDLTQNIKVQMDKAFDKLYNDDKAKILQVVQKLNSREAKSVMKFATDLLGKRNADTLNEDVLSDESTHGDTLDKDIDQPPTTIHNEQDGTEEAESEPVAKENAQDEEVKAGCSHDSEPGGNEQKRTMQLRGKKQSRNN